MDSSHLSLINRHLSTFRDALRTWNASIDITDDLLQLTLFPPGDLDACCRAIPRIDVLLDVAVIGATLTDRGVRSLLAIRREALKYLVLREGKISGQGLVALANCPNLERLIVEFDVDPQAAMQAIAECKILSSLEIKTQKGTMGAELPTLAGLRHLQNLEITAESLGPNLEGIGSIQRLVSLRLEAQDLDDRLLSSLNAASSLNSFTLVSNKISGAGLAALRPLTSLKCGLLQNAKSSPIEQ